jgi:hypothetical protein
VGRGGNKLSSNLLYGEAPINSNAVPDSSVIEQPQLIEPLKLNSQVELVSIRGLSKLAPLNEIRTLVQREKLKRGSRGVIIKEINEDYSVVRFENQNEFSLPHDLLKPSSKPVDRHLKYKDIMVVADAPGVDRSIIGKQGYITGFKGNYIGLDIDGEQHLLLDYQIEFADLN